MAWGSLPSQTTWGEYLAPRVSVSGLPPRVLIAASMSSSGTIPSSRRIWARVGSPRRLLWRMSAVRSWEAVSLPIWMRISPSRSRFRLRISSSSSRGAGARLQNSCLYLSLAWQKQRWQDGQSLLGSRGSWEHHAAATASNSPRQFQQVAG